MKRRVKQNHWGNWRGYEGNKFVREFAHEPAWFVGSSVAVNQSTCDSMHQGGPMPEAAQQWLNETANP